MTEGDVYMTLHRAIVDSELSPGERLVEEELALRLGASRGAVRAALARLDHEGLVVRERNRGAQVRRISIAEAIEIVEGRAALESLAAGYAALRAREADIEELERLLAGMQRLREDGELLAVSARNGELHRRILEISDHRVAIAICGQLRSQVVRFQFRTVLAPGRAAQSGREHAAIVAAIAAGDRTGAETAMRLHLGHVADVLTTLARDGQVG